MLNASALQAEKAGRCNPPPHEPPEVGHLVLGDRRFSIVEASTPQAHHGEVCRFKICDRAFAVRADAPGTGLAGQAARDIADRLTARELQVAVLVAQGHATKNIAYRLHISEWTVGTYLRRVFAKLNVDSRAAMVYRCAPLIQASLTPAPFIAESPPRHGMVG